MKAEEPFTHSKLLIVCFAIIAAKAMIAMVAVPKIQVQEKSGFVTTL